MFNTYSLRFTILFKYRPATIASARTTAAVKQGAIGGKGSGSSALKKAPPTGAGTATAAAVEHDASSTSSDGDRGGEESGDDESRSLLGQEGLRHRKAATGLS